jgi:phage-related minor tail protein
MNSAMKAEPMPDLLAQAFNQAVRPYTEKIEQLESQLADMQSWVEQLEQQRAEVHSWIDKRGLRPGTPSCLPIALPAYVY